MYRSLLIEIRNHPFAGALLLAVAARVAVFCSAILWPIPNEDLLPVSPLITPGYQDFQFYTASLQRYISVPLLEIFGEFVAFYQRPFEQQFGFMIAAPVYPMLLVLFGFGEGATLPFAGFYLLLSCFTAALWLRWMAQFGVSHWWLFLFAVAPNAIWFMLVLSPDALFAFLVSVFFFSYFKAQWNHFDLLFCGVSIFLILLTRPNGYSILLFVSCLSGYHPHPLYVVCLLGLQARAGAGALRRRSG